MVKTKKSEGVFGLKKCRNMREMGLKFVLRGLGLLLLTAAVLKGHELLTTPMANTDLWSNRYFLIFQVEFELALGIWLLSGLFKRAAWLAAVVCFGLFCCVTLYKGLIGAASCGCFGKVHVNPWITLFAIDLPATMLLFCFFPHMSKNKDCVLPQNYLHYIVHTTVVIFMSTIILSFSGANLSSFENAKAISKGYEYNINKYAFFKKPSETGYKLVLLYKRDCPNCIKAINIINRMSNDKVVKNGVLNIFLVEIPPFGMQQVECDELIVLGLLVNSVSKERSPKIVFMKNNFVYDVWNTDDFDYEKVLQIVSFVNS
jgi:hypothetical protein